LIKVDFSVSALVVDADTVLGMDRGVSFSTLSFKLSIDYSSEFSDSTRMGLCWSIKIFSLLVGSSA
jgi:hypothetical protein